MSVSCSATNDCETGVEFSKNSILYLDARRVNEFNRLAHKLHDEKWIYFSEQFQK